MRSKLTVSRRGWFVAIALVALISAVLLRSFWRGSRPNIVLVTFDTTRADRLGAYGYEHGLTTAFDQFASEGVLFEHAFAPCPITLPSHATMLTGLYPPEHDLRVNGVAKLASQTPFLPEILKGHGFRSQGEHRVVGQQRIGGFRQHPGFYRLLPASCAGDR